MIESDHQRPDVDPMVGFLFLGSDRPLFLTQRVYHVRSVCLVRSVGFDTNALGGLFLEHDLDP